MKENKPLAGGNLPPVFARKFSVKEVLAALIFFILLFASLPMEYDDIKARTFIYPIMWIGAGYIVFKIFPKKSLTKSSLLIALGIVGLFYILTQVTGFCAWGHHGTLYVNKKDKSIKIICRTYDCFGTAEGCRLFKERRLTQHIKWVTSLDENPVDTTKWQSVSLMSSE